MKFALLLFFLAGANAAELRVSTDFEGGSAKVDAIDQDARVIHMSPGGDPQRGWPCWWFVRVDGVEKDEEGTISLGGSERPARNNGADTGKPLSVNWAMPMRAAISTDRETWQHTAPGRREGSRMLYEITGTGGPLWIAWGPPFTPRDTDVLLAQAERKLPAAKSFELARTREGRPVRGLRITESNETGAPVIWVHARQHAWESGASWVGAGFVEWLTSDDVQARWLRQNAEIVVVPIMDVDNAATGNGGKEAAPRDHNRDWNDEPIYPEVAAAQRHLRGAIAGGRLAVFLDLHNPAPSDLRPFFFLGPAELLDDAGRKRRAEFLACAQDRITDPLLLEENPRLTGASYHPLWRQISGNWVMLQSGSRAVVACLETPWNTLHSTVEGYRTVGRQLGLAVADYLRLQPR